MRLAIVGKGGAGKTFICGALARLLADHGYPILALDMDTVPGLAYSLGISAAQTGDRGLPENLAERVPEKGWQLKDGVDINEVVRTHALPGPRNIRFLQLGKLPDCVKPTATVAFRYVLEQYNEAGWHLITDLAAGTRQPFFGWSNFADVILIVVTPSAASLLTAQRLARLANRPSRQQNEKKATRPFVAFVANKLHSQADLQQIKTSLASTGLPILGKIPADEAIFLAEVCGQVPVLHCADSAAIVALHRLADQLEQRFICTKPESEMETR